MTTTDSTLPPSGTYIPGFARMKWAMIFLGLALVLLGVWEMKTPLRLLVIGDRARAEATAVIKSKPGLPDLVLQDDPQVEANVEPRDRSYTFWNEFTFRAGNGTDITVRAAVGSQLKPLYPLLDPDGLPNTSPVWYDPTHPQTVVFPSIVSTWFAPGMLIFIGALMTLIGAVLLRWANKPIALPHIPSSPTA